MSHAAVNHFNKSDSCCTCSLTTTGQLFNAAHANLENVNLSFDCFILCKCFLHAVFGVQLWVSALINVSAHHTISARLMKKRSEKTQTLHSKKNSPRRRPFPGTHDGQNLISWRWSLPLPTNPVWWGSMYAISSYHGNRPTHTQIHPQTGPITIHCAAAS